MRRLAGLFTALVLLGGFRAAQGEAKPFATIDPYTKSAPDLAEKAGYVSLGPFRFGDDHTSDQVATLLERVPLIWVETAHFKLGSGLPEYSIGDDKEEKERLKVELERLAERLPDVKTRLKKLDPWLRLHLFAQRLEDTYALFLTQFGLKASEFPTAPPDPKKPPAGPYMGEGPYLGASSKYTVLLFDKKSALERYTGVYCKKPAQAPLRWHFDQLDSWLYATAAEFLEGDYENDTALTCAVVTGVAQNLAAGFRGHGVPLPLAVSEGIAHWFSRRVDPRYHFFSNSLSSADQAQLRVKGEWNWAPTVRARAERKVFPSTSDMLGWADADALGWADHLILWSRMDYLMAREDGAAGSLLRRLKDPLPGKEPLTSEQLAERARRALEEAIAGDLAKFDNEWSEWVLKTYPKL